ncbi:NUDIX hydrolase [Galactobacter sp.]|uniref:NUDIX hydrolase n=1 Tax=Galactobacter sp. TaxID=2676125 RepID=UPI0025C69060|nr:NUDIX hydrolase [Galactobacter sp.]
MSSSVQRPLRSCDPQDFTEKSFKVLAAGALPWRRHQGRLQVLVIHRPKYDDWSFPKGKLEKGETLAQCAVREVKEEGGLKITLGIPLTAISYDMSKGSKAVYYWAAHATGTPRGDGREVDGCAWLDVGDALERLSNEADRLPLQALAAAHDAHALDTSALILARHAKAKPRSGWTRAEGERPLATSGVRQAESLAALLTAWRPSRVRSSPWRRCMQTVAPYAAAQGIQVRTVPALTEHSATKHPAKAVKALEKLLTKSHCQLVCTHRPVLPTLLPVLASHGVQGCDRTLPAKDPYLRPGAVIVVHRPVDDLTRIVSVEVHEPFDD